MWEFDCATGEYDYDPTKRVPTFEVKLENGEILHTGSLSARTS